jgi:predicted dehydrogenase
VGSGKLKAGVLGINRGSDFARIFEANPHTELAAICDFNTERVQAFMAGRDGIAIYDDYDKMLEHGLDIVMIAGYLNEHAPQAVKALEAGCHVLSEVTACKTPAEGVALCRAVEKTGKTYMYAENYCYFTYTQEMQRLYGAGEIGEYLYGDCEYIHKFTIEENAIFTDDKDHWRNWIPSTYYCTHALGPVLTITGTRPVKVSGFVVPNTVSRTMGRKGDDASIIVCTMDNNAITKVVPWANLPHKPFSLWYSLYGTRGAFENNRFRPQQTLNVTLDEDPESEFERSYQPKFRRPYDSKLDTHGGGDFFVVEDFVDAVINKKEPPLDVYMAMDMTLPGILGYRSALSGNASLEVPDFRKEEVRKYYENDHWSPDPADRHIPGQPSPSILGEVEIPESVYRELDKWRAKTVKKDSDVRRIFS